MQTLDAGNKNRNDPLLISSLKLLDGRGRQSSRILSTNQLTGLSSKPGPLLIRLQRD